MPKSSSGSLCLCLEHTNARNFRGASIVSKTKTAEIIVPVHQHTERAQCKNDLTIHIKTSPCIKSWFTYNTAHNRYIPFTHCSDICQSSNNMATIGPAYEPKHDVRGSWFIVRIFRGLDDFEHKSIPLCKYLNHSLYLAN